MNPRYLCGLMGSGAYEGLTALVIMQPKEDAQAHVVHGIIFPGELPEFPECPAPVD